jgi:predicted Zn-dependent protease
MTRLTLAIPCALLLSACATAASVSTQDEVQIGRDAAQQVESQLPMLNDRTVDAYVTQLGRRIASRTSRGSELDWQFAVVNSDEVNAFALPGGYIYVNRGVLQRASTMDELAGVLGHEIEHVVRRHSIDQMAKVNNANMGVGILCALTRVCESGVAQAGIIVGGQAVFAKFGRGDEIEADEGGFRNVVAAGIDPQGMLTFFQKLLSEEQRTGGNGATAGWFSDHPGTQDRVNDIQRMLSQMSASQMRSLIEDESAFRTMKQRLSRLAAAPRPR